MNQVDELGIEYNWTQHDGTDFLTPTVHYGSS